MAQACDGYTRTALMGNWYEERLAPEQKQRDPNAVKKIREEEQEISVPGNDGKLLPLPRVGRNPHWTTNDLIPDDGFREFRSQQATNFDARNMHNMFNFKDCRPIIKSNGQRVMYPECNPHQIQTGGAKNYHLLEQTNMHQVERTREVPQFSSDFGSTFKSHPETHQKFYGITNYQQSFQNPKGMNVKDIIAEQKSQQKKHAAGSTERFPESQGLQMTSVLTGEKYKNENDPKDNTAIQRAWLPTQDPGIIQANQALEKNSKTANQFKPFNPIQTYKQTNSQVLPYDIATSLPLADGVYTLQRKYDNPGEFRHIRADVTIIHNKPLTKK